MELDTVILLMSAVGIHCRSVTVISPSCVMAGILSTTAFILGVENGLKLIESYYRAEGCITTEKFRSKTNKFDEHIVS